MSETPASSRGIKLKKARLMAEIWTQKELAQRTGLAPSIISDLERGRREMSPAWAKRIAGVLGIELESLLESQDEV